MRDRSSLVSLLAELEYASAAPRRPLVCVLELYAEDDTAGSRLDGWLLIDGVGDDGFTGLFTQALGPEVLAAGARR